ncbi:(Fe-S)-binding protein [Paenibacillus sp. GYB003]|uniref:(Fe-S)-binding protein n=1 Tax=Paenibacillus sp. GYB003 TaxID=2994392 RepID=UPI002F968E81
MWKAVNIALFLCAAGCGLFWFGQAVLRRAAYIRLGQKEDRVPFARDRLRDWAGHVFGHKRLLRDPRSGAMHLAIFYGFIVVQFGALDIVVKGLFGVRLPLPAYDWFVLSQEVTVVVILAAVLYAAYRRYAEKLARLKRGWKPSVVLFFIGSLMASVLLTSAFERIWKSEPFSPLAPIASVLAAGMDGFIGKAAGEALYYAAWWIHLLILLAFLVYVPQSKHLHLLTAPVNLALGRREPGKLRTLDLEDEGAETFGTGAIEQFTRKQLLDLYACVECGRCTNVCPAAGTGKLLSPMHLIVKLRDHLTEKGAAVTSKRPWVPSFVFRGGGDHASVFRPRDPADRAGWQGSGVTDITPTMGWQKDGWVRPKSAAAGSGEAELVPIASAKLIGDVVTEEELWACTTCRNCEEQCPVGNEHVDKLIDMRRYLVLTEGMLPAGGARALHNIERQGNPWGISRGDRTKWLDDLDGIRVPTVREEPDFDYLLFVGSMGSYDNRTRKVTIALVKLLAHAGVRFAILGAEEKNSGDTPRRMGNELLFRECCEANIALFRKYNVRKIVTACPHTYNAMKREYPEFGLEAEVVHHTELLARLLREGKLSPSHPVEERTTYHDSCYLGRYNGEYDAPRAILRAIPGLRLAEMERSGANAMCCGAGGGLMWQEETAGKRVNVARVEQALAVAPTVIASACPYCLTMMEDGTKLADTEGVAARDVAELLAASVFGPPRIDG